MKKTVLSLTFFCVSSFSAIKAQTNPAITQWLQNNSITGSYYEEGNSTAIDNGILANVQSVHYDENYVYITTTGVPAYITGPYLDGNIDTAEDVEAIYQLPLEGVASNDETETSIGNNGVFINGVSLWDWQDTVSWDEEAESICGGPTEITCSSDSGGPGGGGPGGGPGSATTTVEEDTVGWNRDAVPAELEGFDCAKGHPAGGNYHHHQNPTAFDLADEVLSNICDAYPADGLYIIDSSVHSPIIGFAFDGFPVYGPYAYEGTDGTGSIVRMKSSYDVDDSVTTRVDGPDIDEVQVYTNSRTGEEVTEVFFNGYFKEDYVYTANTASDYLDDHNGRFCITPEYPNGTYAYFATVDEDHNSVFPYLIGPTFYGEVVGTTVSEIPTDAVQYDSSTLSVVNFDEDRLGLSVYPNPAQDFIAIQSNAIQTSTLKVELVNELGQVVLEDKILQGSTLSIIKTHTLYNGIYFVRVSGGDSSKTYKIIINKF